jgi:tRNA pseudouridine-54 N-methylase
MDVLEINQEYQDLCAIIRSIFFISNEIRRENTFLIINNDKEFSIELNGKTLKNLRPDFYNIFMFLKKVARILSDKLEISILDKQLTILPGVSFNAIKLEKFLIE